MFAASGLNGPPCGTPIFPPTLMICFTRCMTCGSWIRLAILIQQHRVPNRVEIARQIHIDDRGHAPHHTAPDLRQGAMWCPLWSISVRVRAKVRLEDGFEDQLQCSLHHAVADTRDLKRSKFSIALRDLHRAVLHGLVPACDKVFSHRRKKRSPSRGFNVRETLAVDARGTAVSLRDTIGLLKGLDVRNMHEQTPEAMRLFRLRLSIDPPSQFLQIAGCLCHLTPASL